MGLGGDRLLIRVPLPSLPFHVASFCRRRPRAFTKGTVTPFVNTREGSFALLSLYTLEDDVTSLRFTGGKRAGKRNRYNLLLVSFHNPIR